ncbi:XdhC family protein [Kallotenue papyrolyticum]|uniref:XdhC family protein n=1 Tax=Kallotenue papyrolyticum TaxID=1325125 RepID=UPI00047862C2|nr:XdhC family protein [Kallotenue papyrolyticum]
MDDVLTLIDQARARGEPVAIATVARTYGSAPRQVGAKMVVTAGGAVAGSVSGGCVEGAVFEECQRTIKTGRPKLLTFGVSNEQAWEVGLACGGTIEVFVERLDW